MLTFCHWGMGEGEEQNEELKGRGGQDELQILNCILDWTNKYSRKHGSAHTKHIRLCRQQNVFTCLLCTSQACYWKRKCLDPCRHALIWLLRQVFRWILRKLRYIHDFVCWLQKFPVFLLLTFAYCMVERPGRRTENMCVALSWTDSWLLLWLLTLHKALLFLRPQFPIWMMLLLGTVTSLNKVTYSIWQVAHRCSMSSVVRPSGLCWLPPSAHRS